MQVLDSSVWIYAITYTCEDAVAVVDQVINSEFRVAVDAYVFNEVIEGIERSGSGYDEISEAQTRFAEIVHGNPAIQEPTQHRVQALDLDTVRSDERVQLLGLTWGIQPKDVPIVQLAYRQSSEPTVIFTSDQDFSNFEPREYGVDDIVIRYVNCP